MTFVRWGGTLLRRRKFGGKIARSKKCCCVGGCCACMPTATALIVSFSGAVTGEGLIFPNADFEACWAYSGSVELTGGPCFDQPDGNMCISPRLFLRCPKSAGTTPLTDIELMVQDDFGCGLCHVGVQIPPAYHKPYTISCNNPCGLIGTWQFFTTGFCACGAGQLVTITISEEFLPCP